MATIFTMGLKCMILINPFQIVKGKSEY